MVGISIVNDPAIQSSFQAFDNKEIKPKFITLEKEYKKELLGAALRPNLPILRTDNFGNYYYGVFTCEIIEKIRNKFHKLKYTNNVNLEHGSEAKINSYLIESYIITTPTQLEAVKELGLIDVELGSWIVRYKVEDEEVFKAALDGTFTGFSIEIFITRELADNFKKINKNENSIMNKFNKLINDFKELLNNYEANPRETEVKFTDVVVNDETKTVLRYTEVGEPVLVVTVGEGGEDVTQPATEGEYMLEDGSALVIDAEGKLVEIKPLPETKEEEVPAKEVPAKEVPAEETLKAEVEKLKATIETLKADNVNLSKEIEKLNAKVVEPIAQPAVVNNEVKKVEMAQTPSKPKKITNLDIQLKKLGLV